MTTIQNINNSLNIQITQNFVKNDIEVNNFIENIVKEVNEMTIDFNDINQIESLKNLNKQAKLFTENLKIICDPLEAEGKAIANNRSKITTTLYSGKNAIFQTKLQPILEAEQKLKELKNNYFVENATLDIVKQKIQELEKLKDYEFYCYKQEAHLLIEMYLPALKNTAEELQKQKEAEEQARKEAEEKRIQELVEKKAIEIAKQKEEQEKRTKEEQEPIADIVNAIQEAFPNAVIMSKKLFNEQDKTFEIQEIVKQYSNIKTLSQEEQILLYEFLNCVANDKLPFIKINKSN